MEKAGVTVNTMGVNSNRQAHWG